MKKLFYIVVVLFAACSLAGAQDKIAVHVAGNQISLPLGPSPSTHILKPAIAQYEGIVFNEAFCVRLAHAIGLHAAKVEVRQVEDVDYLLIERYDRHVVAGSEGSPGLLQREHQEDFCQALGFASRQKYETNLGPGIARCRQLIMDCSEQPALDTRNFLDRRLED